MVRRVSRILFIFCMGIASSSLAEAREQLVMPFDCGIKSGVVSLTPAAAKSYPIIGRREEQTLTLCGLPQSAPCRTIVAHRFAISCGGTRVSWMRIVGAIQRRATQRSWIESDRLKFVLPTTRASRSSPSCFDHPADMAMGAGLQRPLLLNRECLPWRRRAAFDRVVLPAGYAPVQELGARLLLAGPVVDVPAADEGASNVPGLQPLITVSAGANEMMMAKADLGAMIDPLPEPVTYEAVAAPATNTWVTVVRAGAGPGTQTRATREAGTGAWVWLLVALALATVAVVLRARFAIAWPIRRFSVATSPPVVIRRFRTGFGSGMANMQLKLNLANGGASVASLIEKTEAAVSQLKDAGPLREVLLSEHDQVRQRLESAQVLAAGHGTADKAAPQFRTLVRELERIQRIADSGAASLLGSRKDAPLPRTASEGYDVLGVNPDVSKNVLKKIVDALRLSWHPDYARDEDDRLVREDRIQRINIALDLINEKREGERLTPDH